MKKLIMIVFVLSMTMSVHANDNVGETIGNNIEHIRPMESIELLNRLRTVECELDKLEIMVDRLEGKIDELDNMDSRYIQNDMGDIL